MKDQYKGKKVFITGHTGFKGSWLATWLLQQGAEVTGYALPPLGGQDHFVQLGLAGRMNHIEGDLLDAARLSRAMQEAAPDIVFHLAAQALVRLSYAQPQLTYATNVMGGVNLLEAVRNTPSVRALVFITSDKCYRNHEWPWGYRESDELGGSDPYSASKACAELVYRSYHESFLATRPGFASATARAGNVIGGGDFSADRIVPDCIRALHKGEAIRVRNPVATRPWQHVLEPLSGYLALGLELLSPQAKQFEGSWNFGPTKDSNRPVGDLVARVIQTWGSGEMIVERQENAPHECRLLHLNCDKAHSDLGWSPTWHFAEGTDETTLWYKNVMVDGADAWETTNRQIRAYQERLERKSPLV